MLFFSVFFLALDQFRRREVDKLLIIAKGDEYLPSMVKSLEGITFLYGRVVFFLGLVSFFSFFILEMAQIPVFFLEKGHQSDRGDWQISRFLEEPKGRVLGGSSQLVSG